MIAGVHAGVHEWGCREYTAGFDCAKTLFDSYITVRSRSDRLNANAVTDDRVTVKWFFLLPY